MKADLETLLRANPFIPFVVTMRSGEALPVHTVKRLMLGTETFCYRDGRGNFRIVPYRAVKRWNITQTPETPSGRRVGRA